MKCRCWLPYRHDADCERARAEDRERARERAASDRLLADLRRVYGDRVVELEVTEPELRAIWGDR